MCAVVAELVGRGRTFIEAEQIAQLALERAVQVAGEAAGHLGDETRCQYSAADWRELIAVRVVLAHAYHRVDPNPVVRSSTKVQVRGPLRGVSGASGLPLSTRTLYYETRSGRCSTTGGSGS